MVALVATASGLVVLKCEGHYEAHVHAKDVREVYTGPGAFVTGHIFEPLIFMAILGWVGANVLEKRTIGPRLSS